MAYSTYSSLPAPPNWMIFTNDKNITVINKAIMYKQNIRRKLPNFYLLSSLVEKKNDKINN